MSAAAAVQNGFSVSQAYDAFFSDGTDVAVGDKLVRGDKSYLVKGLRPYEVRVTGHIQALCQQEAA